LAQGFEMQTLESHPHGPAIVADVERFSIDSAVKNWVRGFGFVPLTSEIDITNQWNFFAGSEPLRIPRPKFCEGLHGCGITASTFISVYHSICHARCCMFSRHQPSTLAH